MRQRRPPAPWTATTLIQFNYKLFEIQNSDTWTLLKKRPTMRIYKNILNIDVNSGRFEQLNVKYGRDEPTISNVNRNNSNSIQLQIIRNSKFWYMNFVEEMTNYENIWKYYEYRCKFRPIRAVECGMRRRRCNWTQSNSNHGHVGKTRNGALWASVAINT